MRVGAVEGGVGHGDVRCVDRLSSLCSVISVVLPTTSAGRLIPPRLTAAHPVAALPPSQWGYQAEDGQQRAGFWHGDQFAAGCERGGSGVEPGAGAAEEGNVRGREGSPEITTGDEESVRTAADAEVARPVPNL